MRILVLRIRLLYHNIKKEICLRFIYSWDCHVVMQNMETAIADDNLGELKAVHESIITNLRELIKLDKFKKGDTVVTDVVERL